MKMSTPDEAGLFILAPSSTKLIAGPMNTQAEDRHKKPLVSRHHQLPLSPPFPFLLCSARQIEEERKRMEAMLQRMLIQRRDFFCNLI